MNVFRSFFLFFIFLVLISPLSAQQLTEQYYGASGSWNDWAYGISATPDGGYIATGEIYTGPGNGPRSYLRKIDAYGQQEWLRVYGDAAEAGYAVAPTADAGYIVCGKTADPDQPDYSDGIARKVDAAGNVLWERRFGGAGIDALTSVCRRSVGGYWVGGTRVTSTENGQDIFVVALSETGATLSNFTDGTPGLNRLSNLAPTADGVVVFVRSGAWNEAPLAFKLDADGSVAWSTDISVLGLGNGNAQVSVYVTPQGTVFCYGGSNGTLTRLSPSGTLLETDLALVQSNSMAGAVVDPGPGSGAAARLVRLVHVIAPGPPISLWARLEIFDLDASGGIGAPDTVGDLPTFQNIINPGVPGLLLAAPGAGGDLAVLTGRPRLEQSRFEPQLLLLDREAAGYSETVVVVPYENDALDNADEYVWYDVRRPDGGHIVVSVYFRTEDLKWAFHLLHLDTAGEVVAEHRTPVVTGTGPGWARRDALPRETAADGSFIVHYFRDGVYRAARFRSDLSLETDRSLEVPVTGAGYQRLYPVYGGGFYLLTNRGDTAWVTRYDRTMSRAWEHEFTVTASDWIPRQLLVAHDGSALALSPFEYNDNEQGLYHIRAFDPASGEVRSQYDATSPFSVDYLEFTAARLDGGWLAAGAYQPYLHREDEHAYALKFDRAGRVAWWHTLGDLTDDNDYSASFVRLEEADCRGYVLSAQFTPGTRNMPAPQSFEGRNTVLQHIDYDGRPGRIAAFWEYPQLLAPVDTVFLPGFTFTRIHTAFNRTDNDIRRLALTFPGGRSGHAGHELALTLSPVPAAGHLCVHYASPHRGVVELRWFDAAGRLLGTSTEDKATEALDKPVFVGTLPAGTYVLEVRAGAERVARKWIKG